MDRVLDPILIASLVVLTTALALIVLVPVDVSPWRDLAGDSLFRDGALPSPPRFRDPSPHRIWLPSDLFVWDSIRSGELPLWERMQGGGYSPVISLYNGVFHPLRWATALVPRSAAPSVLIALALWCAFAGMYLLMRRGIGSGVAAALFGSVAFAFGPATMSMALYSGAVLPMAHLPWAVWMMLRVTERRSFASMLPLVAVLGLTIIAGHPLLIFAAFLGLALLAAGMSISRRSTVPFGLFVMSAIAAAFLVAFAWLPTLLAWDGLWTYKASRIGYGFGYYTFTGWLNLLRSLIVDRLGDGVMLDEAPSFGYAGLAASLLIAAGVAAARRDVAARPFAVLLLIFFLLTFPGPWMAPLIGIPPIAYLKPWYYSGVFGFFLAAVGAIGLEMLWRVRGRIRVAGAALAVIAAAIYLARAGRVLAPRTENAALTSEAYRFLRADGEMVRITGLWGETHLPNIARLTGIEDVRYSGPIMTLRYHLWWLLIDPQVLRHTYPTTRISERVDHPLMRDFGVRYVLQSRLAFRDSFYTIPDPRLRDTMLSKRLAEFPVALRTPSIEVRRIPGDHARAHFASDVTRVDSPAAAAETLRTGSEGLGAVVESEDEIPSGGAGRVTVAYPANSRVSMDVESATGGLVVLHDTFADGWKASIDGREVGVVAVNLLSRGVVVPAGTHRVEMRYSPPGLRAGAGVSAITLLIMALIGVRQTRARSG